MKFNEWINERYSRLNNAIVTCYVQRHNGGWNENHITTQVLTTALGLEGEQRWDGLPQRVKWQTYKLTGYAEQECGDIALLVKIRLAENSYIEGVAYFEAKRQYFKSDGKPAGYKALNATQLSKFHGITHASHLLLYDVYTIEESQAVSDSQPRMVGRAMALSLPIVDALMADGQITHKKLPSFGMPWISLLGQYLRGVHLDFRSEAVSRLKTTVDTVYSPAIILNAAISEDLSLEPVLNDHWIPNRNYVRAIVESEPSPEIDIDSPMSGA